MRHQKLHSLCTNLKAIEKFMHFHVMLWCHLSFFGTNSPVSLSFHHINGFDAVLAQGTKQKQICSTAHAFKSTTYFSWCQRSFSTIKSKQDLTIIDSYIPLAVSRNKSTTMPLQCILLCCLSKERFFCFSCFYLFVIVKNVVKRILYRQDHWKEKYIWNF